jgi:hypothetical protein
MEVPRRLSMCLTCISTPGVLLTTEARRTSIIHIYAADTFVSIRRVNYAVGPRGDGIVHETCCAVGTTLYGILEPQSDAVVLDIVRLCHPKTDSGNCLNPAGRLLDALSLVSDSDAS